MKTYFYLCALILVTVYVGNISAQSEIRIKEWGKSDGIESTIIYGVFQDKNHLIWLCTYNGLYYFDGFKAYKSQILEAEEKTAIEGIVNQLVQSADGRYWLKVGDIMGAYDIYSKVFTPLKTQSLDRLATFNSIGNHLFLRETEKTLLVDQKSLELIPMIFVDEKGETLSDIIRASGSTGKYFSFKDNFPVEVLPSELPGRYYEKKNDDPATVYWNTKGYFKYNTDVHGNSWYMHPFRLEWMVEDSLGRDVTSELLLPFEGINTYYLLTQPEFSWFFTDKGLILWEKYNSHPRYLFEEFPDVLNTINFNVFDLGKTVWTWNRQGIANIKINNSYFSSITMDQNGLNNNFILGIYPFDDSQLLIKHDFSDPYHSLFDVNSKKITKIQKAELFQRSMLEEYEEMHSENDQKEWILKHGEHIHHYASIIPNRNPFTRLFISDGNKYDYGVVPANNVKRGLQLWRISTDTMVFPKIDPLQFADQGDTVWIGTESVGLVALHTPSGKTAQWLPDPTNPSAIPANRVHAVIPAGDGNLWLGTGRGLAYFNKKEDMFTSYRTNDGLIDDRIYCMAFDRNGFLWIGTGNGLSRFDPRTTSFINFTKEDGLVNSEYNRNSAILLEDGTMLMGGMEGIDYFNPDEIEEQLEKPQPMIAHIHNNDKLINRNSQVNFGQEENHFSFYVSADPIWMASTLTYQYKLEGAETDWQSLNYSNVVHYPNLPPGNYRFQVKIANQPEIATYEFQIFPVWYRTLWFKISYVFSGLLLIYLLYRMLLARHLYHLNQEKRVLALKAEQALSITKERERIIADLHDDVGATLSSLHIYGDLAGKVWDEQPEKARDMVGKIKEQSKDLMERMSDIFWSMKEQEKDSLSARIRLYATDLLSSNGIHFSDSISPEVEALIREPDMRRSLLLIIKEALNNIAKHSQATVVNLKVYQKKADLIVKIKDNGRGMDLSIAKNGNGLGNIKYRCTKMNGKFSIKSQPGSGTALTCRIPLATISIASGTNSA